MADTDHTEQQKHIAYFDRDLRWKDCILDSVEFDKLPEGPLQRITNHNDTVLHLAAHSKQKDLVLDLLKKLPKDRNHKLSDIINTDGNTILHEVATSDAMKGAAEELLTRDSDLLIASNGSGETPIFCAARYGQTEMFEFLAAKLGLTKEGPEDYKIYLRRKDRTTVLHISIASECFELASHIADCYPYLIDERDQSSMTALQYLACNPSAFQNEKTQIRRGFIEQLSKSKGIIGEKIIWTIKVYFKLLLDIRRSMIRDERYSLERLVIRLVENDTSWDASINSQAISLSESKKEPEIKEHSSKLSQIKEGQNSQESSTSKYKKSDESPLFLATMSDIKLIVKAVLNFQPEALEHTNKEGLNILHVAILYRRIDIFDALIKFEVLARRLLSATDNEGNSILHMVSQKRKSQASEKMQSPALQLREELLLFEKVKSACKMHFSNLLIKDQQTAEELFAAKNEKLHQEAKEWLMRTTENCTILSVFIATVAFAAAYTVPGGPDESTGIPILNSKPFFEVFIVADVISLTMALTSVVAFGATINLMMTDSPKNVVWDVVAFLPVPIFFLSYSPLRSVVLGHCGSFVQNFLIVVAIPVVIFLLVLFLLLFGAFQGLRWTFKKVCELICKPVHWISGKKSEPKSDTQSPQPTTQV
ncbi:uncharacterized protein LOC117924244 isoform X2 [Vitis riparia]|uniref:uncharacterized protein LOC117924244 isoform X2 n=1 Tax=Vitis riparia TaxID=96939 RepID=UPI00155AC334|nr:uncharacterized protein LOC117924244 isoform X2 [Vitis riparia]